jgi:hypothetical protein
MRRFEFSANIVVQHLPMKLDSAKDAVLKSPILQAKAMTQKKE